MKKVDVLVGAQFGSEGKGLIAGHLAHAGGYDTVVNVNMPNAGHTYILDGKEYMFKVLPNGAVHDNVKRVMLGPDSVFSEERLLEECAMIPGLFNKLIIHENCAWLRNEHKFVEKRSGMMERMGSTAQGSSAAMIDKIRRLELATVGSDPGEFTPNVVSHADWMEHLARSSNVLLEGCQGYSLGLNAGFYPYCTSRDCTPGRLAAGAGIPHHWIRRVIGAARLHPIRVGGNSGPPYPDQRELGWEELGLSPEYTTVTGRQRRIFSFSLEQMIASTIACGYTDIFLNFCNYDPKRAQLVKDDINKILAIHGQPGARVTYTGWGPTDADIKYEE